MTKTELIKKVLQRLRVLEVGEEPDADQTTTVGDAYDQLYRELEKDKVVDWGSTGEIPNKQALQMVSFVAGNLVDEFFVPEARAQRLIIQADNAHQRLYELDSLPYESTENPEYY